MGHISRHVRPGSKAVHAIVDQSEHGPKSRTFRRTLSNGGSVAGGGINNLARVQQKFMEQNKLKKVTRKNKIIATLLTDQKY